jgi:hypothetical protein
MVNTLRIQRERGGKEVLVCGRVERKAMGCDLTFAVINYLV